MDAESGVALVLVKVAEILATGGMRLAMRMRIMAA